MMPRLITVLLGALVAGVGIGTAIYMWREARYLRYIAVWGNLSFAAVGTLAAISNVARVFTHAPDQYRDFTGPLLMANCLALLITNAYARSRGQK